MTSSKINIFEIQLDNPMALYTPRETISGKLVIELNRAKELRAVKLRFKGMCEVNWNETDIKKEVEQSRTIHCTGSEIYFRTDLYLFGSANGQTIEMKSGRHIFPFSYNLPHNIPSSFEHYIGTVRYHIKAIIDRPWKFDHTIIKIFTVKTPLKLDLPDHHPQIRIEEYIEENFWCILLCISRGNISILIRIPSTIFACGDTIKSTIKLDKTSSYVDLTEVILELHQKLTFQSQTPGRIKNENNIVKEVEKNGPFSKDVEIDIDLEVPELPYSNLQYCNLINIDYCLSITVHVTGCHCAIKRSFDVIIGSASTISSMSLQQPLTLPIPSNSMPSAPPINPEMNSIVSYPLPQSTIQYNIVRSNEECIGILPAFPMCNENPRPYPPSPHIGFIHPTPSSQNKINQEPPPAYDEAINESGQKNH